MLIDDGLLVPRDGRWTATRDLACGAGARRRSRRCSQPASTGSTPGERAVIERAAVEGKVFHEGSVAALARRGGAAIGRDALEHARAQGADPARPAEFAAERTFRFRHLLIRDAAYDSIPKAIAGGSARAVRAAGSSSRTGDRTTEYEEIIGYHLEQAYRYRREVGRRRRRDAGSRPGGRRRLGSAGHRAFIRGDAPRGRESHLTRGALLPGGRSVAQSTSSPTSASCRD